MLNSGLLYSCVNNQLGLARPAHVTIWKKTLRAHVYHVVSAISVDEKSPLISDLNLLE